LEDVRVTANHVINQMDQQIVLPTKAQIESANNRFALLRNLQLPRLTINPMNNSIKLAGGENIQLRINGIEVSKSEIIALNPKDILKVEYIDNPRLRSNNVWTVINFVTQRNASGGNISLDTSNGFWEMRYGKNYLSSKYITKENLSSA